MSRFLTFSVFGLFLFILCFGAWKVLHLAPAAAPRIPPAAEAALSQPTEMRIAATSPAPPAGTAGEKLAGVYVTASAVVTDPVQRTEIADALISAVFVPAEPGPQCFCDSVAIQVKSAAGEFIFVPCFRCQHMKIVLRVPNKAEEWAWVDIRGPGEKLPGIFQALHVPLALN